MTKHYYPYDPERHGHYLSLEDAIKHNPVAVAAYMAGGQAEVAHRLGLTRSCINKWVRNKRVPPKHAVAVEKMCAGKITRYQLCPDIFEPS